MGAWDNFKTWLLGGAGTYEIEQSQSSIADANKALDLKLLTMLSAVGYLANGLAMSDWRTIIDGKDVRGEEFFRLNNCPNINQNKSEFCAKLVYKLCVENEVLIISPKRDNSLYIADSFSVEEKGTKQNKYENIVIEGDDNVYSSTSQYVIHLKANWIGLAPLLATVAEQYENMITIANTGYSKQVGEKGTFRLGTVQSGNKEQQKAYMKQVRDRFEAYFKNSSVVLPLYAGEEYTMNATAHRNTSEMNDVINISDEFAERVALALRVPSGILKGNVENTEHAREDLIMYGIKPIAVAIEQEYNAKRVGKARYQKGTYLMIDTLPVQLASTTAAAAYCDKMISSHQASPNELRLARHEPLIDAPEADQYFLTLNYGPVNSQDRYSNLENGGENDGKTVSDGSE